MQPARGRNGTTRPAPVSTHPSEREALFHFWADQGLSVRASSALSLAGCRSVADIRQLGRNYFTTEPNCGPVTLREIASLVHGWNDKVGA
jgi:hypothetical protein